MEQWNRWTQDWIAALPAVAYLLLILAGAWLLRRMVRVLFRRLGDRSLLPPEVAQGLLRVASFLITAGAVLLILDLWGVSATVLWTAFTGFAAVAAVAFFAAWSVLSNIFCTLLIAATRPFRLLDHVELLENGEARGLRGQVIDVNLIYTTLQETTSGAEAGTVLQIPNSLFFQRTLRRWRGGATPPARTAMEVTERPVPPARDPAPP